MADIAGIARQLNEEHDALDERVADLTEDQWRFATPAEGWTVADTISHLAYYDARAVDSMLRPDVFKAHFDEVMSGKLPKDTELGRSVSGSELLTEWRAGRAALLAAVDEADPKARVAWYGPAMSLASFLTARLMETWAHGQDVADALGLPPVVSDRLKNVCHIGVGARAYAFMIHGVEDPGDPVRVEVTAPSGETWSWGPEDATDRIEGPAIDFALVFTQRRHPNDTSVKATGPTAELWLSIAQAFAGPAGTGRQPLT